MLKSAIALLALVVLTSTAHAVQKERFFRCHDDNVEDGITIDMKYLVNASGGFQVELCEKYVLLPDGTKDNLQQFMTAASPIQTQNGGLEFHLTANAGRPTELMFILSNDTKSAEAAIDDMMTGDQLVLDLNCAELTGP